MGNVKQIIALFILMFAAVGSANAACLSQSQTRQAVANGQAAPLGAVRGQVNGEIVKAQLCQQGGGYVYRLSVLKNGKVTTVTVNAGR